VSVAATGFDLDRLRRGIEDRDAEALASLYAEDAELVEVDQRDGPSSPRVLRGRRDIAAHLREVCAREMEHRLERPVLGDGRIAFTESCRYPDGVAVLCMASADLDQRGHITQQVAVTAWDA
jgi:hypothetical protein